MFDQEGHRSAAASLLVHPPGRHMMSARLLAGNVSLDCLVKTVSFFQVSPL